MLLLKRSIQNSINGKVTSDCVKNALKQIGGEDYNLPKGNLVEMSYNLGYHKPMKKVYHVFKIIITGHTK